MCPAHGTPQALSQVTVMVLLAAKWSPPAGLGLPAASSQEGCSGADTRCALAGLAVASSQLLGLGTARGREQMFGSAPQDSRGAAALLLLRAGLALELLPSLEHPLLHFGESRMTPCPVPASP